MTTKRLEDDHINALLANVRMSDHDRRNAEREFRVANRIVEGMIRLFDGSKTAVRALRSSFATLKAKPQ